MTSKGVYKDYSEREKKRFHEKLGNQLVRMAADIVKQAKENANQPPPGHPQVQTGTLRRAIIMDVDRRKLEAKVGIMTGSKDKDKALEYAARIEFGFTGVDSAGRVYNQPPYPYLFPAVELITKRAKEYLR